MARAWNRASDVVATSPANVSTRSSRAVQSAVRTARLS